MRSVAVSGWAQSRAGGLRISSGPHILAVCTPGPQTPRVGDREEQSCGWGGESICWQLVLREQSGQRKSFYNCFLDIFREFLEL